MIQIDMPMPEKCSDCIFCDDNCSCVASEYDGLGINVGCANRTGRRDIRCPLKQQEAVKPVLDEQTGRLWLRGKCGSYVGFEDNDPHDPNEFDKYCRECGRPVL